MAVHVGEDHAPLERPEDGEPREAFIEVWRQTPQLDRCRAIHDQAGRCPKTAVWYVRRVDDGMESFACTRHLGKIAKAVSS